MKKELQNIRMGMTWTSYIASAYGVLCGAGLWQGEIHQLMGMTGMAFHFLVHETCCPSSTSMYDWNLHHFQMMDRIGIYTDSICIANQPDLNTSEKLKTDTIGKIRESIDKGRAVITWAPTPVLEFGIIRGYDDDERIFPVIDCTDSTGEHLDPLLYDNLGKGEVPMLYIQRFIDKVEVDKEKAYRQSLIHGMKQWKERHFDSRYANGKAAYDNIISSLQKENYNPFGLTYIINVYADSKKCLAAYLPELVKNSKHLQCIEKAIPLYNQVSAHFQNMVQIAPFRGPDASAIDKQRIPELIDIFKQCRELETRATGEIINTLELEL